jgi:uncharacterized membrane protein YtjA (UPF0391 family)
MKAATAAIAAIVFNIALLIEVFSLFSTSRQSIARIAKLSR